MNKCSTKTILALSLMAASAGVSAHGYVSETNGGIAGSRAALCKFPTSDTQEKNTNCGSVQWEPQSVEGPEGFPEKYKKALLAAANTCTVKKVIQAMPEFDIQIAE